MRVIVTFVDTNETRIEGDAPIFDGVVDYHKGYDKRLANIGFWMAEWRYAGHGGASHKSKVFVPWTSCLMVQTLKEDRGEEERHANDR